jgi:hypothetical protein
VQRLTQDVYTPSRLRSLAACITDLPRSDSLASLIECLGSDIAAA